jgi:hypothetical protein
MRWFWQRRKKDAGSTDAKLATETPERRTRVTAPRAIGRSTPLAMVMEPRDALLAFTRDLLNAQGARVRVEEDDLVTAAFSDGSTARYTTTLTRARAEEGTTLLTQGAPALAALFEEAGRRARISTAALSRSDDPAAIALRALSGPSALCGRCAVDGHERWQASRPTCDTCPLRHDALAFRWESRPVAARIVRWEDESGIELTYRITGRDRRGRRDEWLRLAFSLTTGARVPLLALDQITAAQPMREEALSVEAPGAIATERAQESLRPSMEALSGYLAQRVGEEFQRRVEDVTATHERLKRERPDDVSAITTSLERELASMADVYGIEVEASLEAICHITSPVAFVAIETEHGEGPTVTIDVGRGVARAPTCTGCGSAATVGRVCVKGHIFCSGCAEACARCEALHCPVCDATPLAACGLCREPTCGACARTCDACGERFCADHMWSCAMGDQTLCLRDLILCGECQAPLCQAHAASCSACGESLCPSHARVCKTGGETLCATHASACATCQQPLCDEHVLACEECGRGSCRDDIFTCLGCGRALCSCSSPAPCLSCGVSVCSLCRSGTNACPACRNLAPASESDLAFLRLAAELEPAISLKRSWLTGQNTLARVFVSRGLGREEAYLISEQGEIIASRRKGWRAR